jgi:hypothetical protein
MFKKVNYKNTLKMGVKLLYCVFSRIHYVLLLGFLLLGTFSSYAQQEDSLVFSKGRFLTGLYGTLSNQTNDVTSGGSVNITGYEVGTKSGRFLKDNWALGLNFSLSKSEYAAQSISIASEDLLIGLWSRLYFAHKGSAALYAEITPYYTAIHRKSSIGDDQGGVVANEEVFGSGFGVTPGFGFTYIINQNVGFGMTLSYPLARIYVDTEDLILNNTVSDTYNTTELQFSFNFQIYLDQFFF